MDIRKRHLIPFLWLLLGFTFASTGHSQPTPEEATGTFRLLAVGNTASSLLYDAAPNKPVAVEAGGIYLSQPYKSPKEKTLTFYRLIPPVPPETRPKKEPVTSINIDPARAYIVVLATSPDPQNPESYKTRAFAYDDEWESHPYKSTRILNFSHRPIAVQLGADTLTLQPGSAHLFPVDLAAKAAPVKVARLEENEWVLKLRRLQRGIPNTRLTLLISDVIPTLENPSPTEINLTHVFDTSPPPKKS